MNVGGRTVNDDFLDKIKKLHETEVHQAYLRGIDKTRKELREGMKDLMARTTDDEYRNALFDVARIVGLI